MNGIPFAVIILGKMAHVCHRLYLITGHEGDKVEEEIIKAIERFSSIFPPDFSPKTDLTVLRNPRYRQGMLTGLQYGLEHAKNTDWILYHFVDQPGLPVQFYREFTACIEAPYQWIQPSHNNRAGHPLLIHRSLFPSIISLTVDQSLREVSRDPEIKKKFFVTPYREIFQDIDTPDDYRVLSTAEE